MPCPCPRSTTAEAHRRNGVLPEAGVVVMTGLSVPKSKGSSILSSTSPFHMPAVLQASSIKGATVQGEARKGGLRDLKAQPRCEGFVEQL